MIEALIVKIDRNNLWVDIWRDGYTRWIERKASRNKHTSRVEGKKF